MSRAAVVCLAVLSTCTCARPPARTIERIAIVDFENLSGNPDLTWAGAAISSIAAARSSGTQRLQIFQSRTLRDASLRLATTILEGYFTSSGGQISLHGALRDAESHRTTSTWTVAAGDVVTLAAEVAEKTGGPVVPYTSSNPEAIRACFRASTAPDLASAEASLRDAVRLDPQYGTALLALHDVLAQTDRSEEARAIVASVGDARLTPVEKARVSVLTASNPRQQIGALMALARLRPGDVETWRQTADRAMSHRLYEQAVTAMNELLKLNPADETALNLRGYALTYAGDLERASEAFAEYRRRLPDSVNAIDSTAEMMFFFRRYAEAATLFIEAHAKNPGNLGGAEPFRAAYSQFLAGNLSEADRLFAMFVSNPEDVGFAIWRRWTGRPVDKAPAALRSLWALQDGDRKSAADLAAAARRQPGDRAMANLAGIATVLATPSVSPDQWRSRLRQMIPAPQQQPVREQLLGWALLLDGHSREAVGHWRTALDRTSGQFDNQPRILLAASLLASGQEAEARKVMPHGFLPPANLAPSLDVLVFPIAASVVKKLHSQPAAGTRP